MEEGDETVEFKTTVTLPDKMSIPSVNKHKQPSKYGRMYKPKKIAKFQEEVTEQIKNSNLMGLKDIKSPIIHAHFKFVFRRRFWRRDVTNMFKAVEDAVRDAIEVDDSKTIHITGEKIESSGNLEYIDITMKVLNDWKREDRE